MFAVEVATDPPYFFPLSHYKCSGPHQAVCFLPKVAGNVRDVEFATAFRLTSTAAEPLSFRVPRIRVRSNSHYWSAQACKPWLFPSLLACSGRCSFTCERL